MSKETAERITNLPDSQFTRIMKLAYESKGVISLGPGEPDFTTPKHIIAAAKKALDRGETHYSPIPGREGLRKAIARKFKRDTGVDVDPSKEVVVSCGSTECIFLSLATMIDPAEEVLVPDPCFLAYEPTVELLNGYPVSVPLREENGFQLTSEDVESAMKDPKRVRAIILNTPSNPTGTVFSRKTLEDIADVIVEHDIYAIVDEAYEKLVYDTKFTHMAELNGMHDHTVTLQTFSKSYAMPGWRLGYAVGPEKLIAPMTNTKIYTTLCAPTFAQIAGETALNGPQACVEKMRRSYDKRRKFAVKRLNEILGFDLVEPKGAFYVFPSIHFARNGKRMTSLEFSEWLLKEAKVLTIPGTEFGRYGEGFVRMSIATAPELIEEAMNRIEKAVKKLAVSESPVTPLKRG
jgi:aminotransferase